MSDSYDSIDVRGLRKTHFKQLAWYIDQIEQSGDYYGNKKQFEERHLDLKELLSKVNTDLGHTDTTIRKKYKYELQQQVLG